MNTSNETNSMNGSGSSGKSMLARRQATGTLISLTGGTTQSRTLANPGPSGPTMPWGTKAGAQGRMGTPSYEDQMAGTDFASLAACMNGVSRTLTPEAFIGDVDQAETSIRALTGANNIPGISSTDPASFEITQLDYPMIGPVENLRAAISRLNSGGAYNATPLANTSATATTLVWTAAATTPMLLGYAIDWGMPQLSFNPFNMTITTSGYLAVDTIGDATPQVVDRNVVVRVIKNGSRLFVVFAARPTGMTIAMAQDARGFVEAEIATATVTISVPAPIIAAGFQAALLPLQPFTPALAQYAVGEDLY